MLLTDHFVEPDFDLGKGVICLMLTRKFSESYEQYDIKRGRVVVSCFKVF